MTLANSIEEFSKNTRIYSEVCAYQALYDRLSKDDKKAIDDAWAKGIGVALIVRALRKEGHKTSNDSVRAHRAGTCKCPKK